MNNQVAVSGGVGSLSGFLLSSIYRWASSYSADSIHVQAAPIGHSLPEDFFGENCTSPATGWAEVATFLKQELGFIFPGLLAIFGILLIRGLQESLSGLSFTAFTVSFKDTSGPVDNPGLRKRVSARLAAYQQP